MDGRYVRVGFLFITQLLLAFFMLIIPTLSTILQETFELTSTGIGILSTSLFAGFGFFSFVFGRLSDRLSFEWAYLLGHVSTGICLIVAGFSRSPWELFVVLFLCGFGDSLISTASARSVVIWFPDRGRATASSIYKIGFPLGAALAALIFPQTALALSWVWVFHLVGIAMVGWGGFVFLALRNSSDQKNRPIAVAGRLGTGVSRSIKRNVYLIGLMGMCAIFIQYCLTTYCIIYLNRYAGHSLFFAGSILSLIQFSGIAGRILIGPASDYLVKDYSRTMLLVMSVIPVGLLLFLQPTNLPLLYLGAVLLGFSAVGWVPLWLIMMSGAAPSEHAGWAIGVGFAINSLGGLLGPPVFGVIADSRGGYPVAFGFLILISLLSLGLVFLVRKKRLDE